MMAALRNFFRADTASSVWKADELIREELFSTERLEQHAISLALAQTVTANPPRRSSLNDRLSDNERTLLSAYRDIGATAAADHTITPAAEWLLDNYHLVDEQIRQIKNDLPTRYYRQLPKLASGPLSGYPRVFGMAWACVAHSDSRFDPQMLRRFVRAYQTIQPLTIGELWAIAITLRVVLVENLRRAAVRIRSGRSARLDADQVADQLLGIDGAGLDVQALLVRHQDAARLSNSFIVQLVKRLRDQDPRVTPALTWLEQHLEARGTTAEQMVHDEHQRQGASNVTVRNIITSMRLVSEVNWPDFFEDVSLVDEVLRSGSEFAAMDFPSRNLYRSQIERLARGSGHTELDIARRLIAATAIAADGSVQERDPGYYLLAGGRDTFARAVGFKPPNTDWLKRLNVALGPAGYMGAVLLLTGALLAVPILALHHLGMEGLRLALMALLGAVPASDMAVAMINRAVTTGVGATLLPALALDEGIPAQLRSMVVVPMMLTTPAALDTQLERLEVHYLASAGGDIHFALLSDWVDAATETTATDSSLQALAAAGIARLNLLHGSSSVGERFYLFHRRRQWSDTEQCWMGWERKRGKLHDLNRLLRGAPDTGFIDPAGKSPAFPSGVRYVITVDADTRLPRESVRRLIGKLAHPLNQPGFDARTGRIVSGYAVLQPRVTLSLPIGREGSAFQRICSNMTGIDPYDSAVSDVYQDLFGEGSYAGKGIYDLDAFESALADRVPDGSLLSHDLFEGTYARAGLVSDIEVVEEFPARYDVAAARTHRWARGDWQLLPWILGRRDLGRSGSGSLPLIGRWKMLDNLRRTLTAPSCVAALIGGWMLPLPLCLLWTGFLVIALALPASIPVLAALIPRRRGLIAGSHLRALRSDARMALLQSLLATMFIAHQAWLMVDAIARTLFRLFVSKRNLLEWVTAAQAQLSERLDLPGVYRRMSASVAIATAALIAIGAAGSHTWWVAMPFVVSWLLAPAVAQRISRSPLVAGRIRVDAADAQALRLVARRTWRYFETFVTPLENYLPPDNFQEDPRAVIANRTSPTNMGLYLLCAISARDFGWIDTLETITRLERTLATMRRLQRFRGHFYNWYDTRDLRPLDPQYVSTVDSGNLAAHLICVANACRGWIGVPVDRAAGLAGTLDAVQLMREALQALPEDRRDQPITHAQLEGLLSTLAADLRADSAAQRKSIVANLIDGAQALTTEPPAASAEDLLFWADAVRRALHSLDLDADMPVTARMALDARLLAIEADARQLAMSMEFDFLLDPVRRLLSIGYNAVDGSLDPSCYDLLASEARLTSFFAIAKNDVPTRHWFRLGREVTPVGHGAALISWSGSMFEYLMPSLVMRAPAGSLLEQTNRLIVQRQIDYGSAHGVPWGISESAYSARDLEFTYQYSNFGVPGLGLKRGLSENLVIAPYATALAAMVDPPAATRNFERLTALGGRGRYGFYEALDYTRSRLPEGADLVTVRAFMAHHQGMSVVALANVLFDGRMRARFHDEPAIRATELLLQERTPRDLSITYPRIEGLADSIANGDAQVPHVRRLRDVADATPQTHLLSNGRYTVMLTSAASGYSRWRGVGITQWQEDTTRDDRGSYIFLRDVAQGTVWSAGFQPTGVDPDSYETTFTEDRVEIIRTDGAFTTALHVVVSPEDDAEVRRVSITNSSSDSRDVEVTSYSELVLAPPAAYASHPTFSKIFVQTQCLPKSALLLATRRRRDPHETDVWVSHHAVVEGQTLGTVEFETDRARFLGRGNEIHSPAALQEGRRLSNSEGTVLDPVFALRYRIRIPAGATARVTFWTAVSETRAGALDLYDKHHDANAFQRAATLAWTQGQVQLRHLGITAEEANLFQQIAGLILYSDASMRPSADVIQRGGGSAAALWAQGISGDLPIVLLRIDHLEDIGIARQLLQAHEYWRLKQLAVDLVILNERGPSYVQDLQNAVETLVRMSQSRPGTGPHGASGSVYVLRSDLLAADTRAVLSAAARVVFVGQRGSIAEQIERRRNVRTTARSSRFEPDLAPVQPLAAEQAALEFFNGLGGFSADGREYVTHLSADQPTPAPWINVIANPQFGFQIAAEGSGYTWSVNSRENQLTQWSNDPVTDRPGEVLYVRDEETGALWGPTLAPVRDPSAAYCAQHGQGYSRFTHTSHESSLELLCFVPVTDSIKICRLRVRNESQRRRKLSVTAYVEWVLGSARAAAAPHIVTEIDPQTGALFARNPWNAVFGSRVAFADLGGQQSQWTADRREFLGRHGRLDRPAGLVGRQSLSKKTGAGLDPCAALQAAVELDPGETTDVLFLLGEAACAADAQTLVARYRAANLDAELQSVIDQWDQTLGTVQVRTPDRSMDLMLNRWLLYQTLACRIWARSAFYQASGAYGFRDQLQDGMALAIAQPALTREHLLRAAGRQFVQGDVQHWWLPPAGQGVRTHIADDRIWLGFAAAHYVKVTGDDALLDENVAYIEGALLQAGEQDAFFEPRPADESASFFEHCARGLDTSLAVGPHGLPLFGTGDWNDGMNRVGELGRGESVWLGWFLYTALTAFAPIADARGETLRASQWRQHAQSLQSALEKSAWDGGWYRRGYYDDGTALGSATSDECRIDSIAQSWSVISGAADPARAKAAMAAVDSQLIRRADRVALLFAPPFDATAQDPGYIKGYPPGLRENGGQYTHAATWSVIAFARLGQGDKAAGLFSLLNPINHTSTRNGLRRYKAEAYAVAADVYSVAPHVGRAGWTWYTGAAGWLYRAGLESILGFNLQGDRLRMAPCIPAAWPGFEITFKYRSSRYEIVVANPDFVSVGIVSVVVDDQTLPVGDSTIHLQDDGGVHRVQLTLGSRERGVDGAATQIVAPPHRI